MYWSEVARRGGQRALHALYVCACVWVSGHWLWLLRFARMNVCARLVLTAINNNQWPTTFRYKFHFTRYYKFCSTDFIHEIRAGIDKMFATQHAWPVAVVVRSINRYVYATMECVKLRWMRGTQKKKIANRRDVVIVHLSAFFGPRMSLNICYEGERPHHTRAVNLVQHELWPHRIIAFCLMEEE